MRTTSEERKKWKRAGGNVTTSKRVVDLIDDLEEALAAGVALGVMAVSKANDIATGVRDFAIKLMPEEEEPNGSDS